MRLAIFSDNMKFIAHDTAMNELAFRMRTNEYADLSFGEFIATRGGCASPQADFDETLSGSNRKVDESSAIDWSGTKFRTGVENQGNCGACYAFATTGVLDTFYAINHDSNGVVFSN